MKHVKSATRETCNMKEYDMEKCNIEIMQFDQIATQKEYNTKKVQHEKRTT